MMNSCRRWFQAALLAFVPMVFAGCAGGEGGSGSNSPAEDGKAMEQQTYAVRGMVCEGCVANVTAALEKLPNVDRAEVSLEEGKAVVFAPSGSVPSADVVAAVADAGYEAEPLD